MLNSEKNKKKYAVKVILQVFKEESCFGILFPERTFFLTSTNLHILYEYNFLSSFCFSYITCTLSILREVQCNNLQSNSWTIHYLLLYFCQKNLVIRHWHTVNVCDQNKSSCFQQFCCTVPLICWYFHLNKVWNMLNAKKNQYLSPPLITVRNYYYDLC